MFVTAIVGKDGAEVARDILDCLSFKRGKSVLYRKITTENSWKFNSYDYDYVVIEFAQNVKFFFLENLKIDIIVLCGYSQNMDLLENLKSNLNEKNYAVINSDSKESGNLDFYPGTTVVTCGINNRACFTASSVGYDKDKIVCCVQRYMNTLSGGRIEPQEFGVAVKNKDDISSLLTAVAAAVISDVEISDFGGGIF